MKMKTNVSVLVVAALTLLMFMEVSATCRQRQMITDKSSNVHSSLEAAAAVGGLTLYQSLPGGQHNQHVPQPPPEHKSTKVHYSFEEVAGPHCNPNVPTCPPSRPTKREQQQQLKVNGKSELMRNYETSINARKHASAHLMI
jgi:hypothetical protein